MILLRYFEVLQVSVANDGRLGALLASRQAVVPYRLAIMSKDGDWIQA